MEKRRLSQRDAIRGFKERFKEDDGNPAPEKEHPTYEIVGQVERYDQRDHPTARAYLVPGTTEYEEYYGRHPELKE